MKNWLLVGIGGCLGALLRYGIGAGMNQLIKTEFPWPTFLINIVGCFLIGILFQSAEANPGNEWLKPLLMIGFLGGFTTFSSFALEGIQLFDKNNLSLAFTYVIGSNVIGFTAAYLGTITPLKFQF
jgi:CrcB protein